MKTDKSRDMASQSSKSIDGKCDQCGRNSKHLHDATFNVYLDNGEFGPSGTTSRHAPICMRCAMSFGLTEPRSSDEDVNEFYFREFFGRIAEDAIVAIFRSFGYSVYPFGYERQLGSAIDILSKRSTQPALKLRSIPDLVIIGEDIGETFLAEVKATTSEAKSFKIEKRLADLYSKHWPEALLMIYEVKAHKIWCNQISLLNFDKINPEIYCKKECLTLNLEECAYPLEELFDFDRLKYDEFIELIKKRIAEYSIKN